MPVGDRHGVDEARDVFVRRLELLGASRISVSIDKDDMNLTMRLANAVTNKTVDQVLRNVGFVTAVAPFAGETLAEGKSVPDWFPIVWDSGGNVRSASVSNQPGVRAVEILLTDDGARSLANYTSRHVGEPLGLALDGIILAIPTIQAPIDDGRMTVVLAEDSAIDPMALAAMLSSGPLPDRWRVSE